MKPSSKNAAHSRFIPREEVGAVLAWTFSAMDGSPGQAVAAIEATPHPELELALQSSRQQAYAEGFDHGRQAGAQEVRDALEASVRKTVEESAVRMAQLLNQTREHLHRNEEQIGQHILELACDLARQVLRQELKSNLQHLRPVIAEALGELVEDGLPRTVRMHPGELALMKEALEETLGQPGPEFVADASISPGGCLIETASSSVDATIEKRWSRAIGNLGLNVTWNPENADV